MQPLTEALAPWYAFYALMGGAAATMIGLLFVAVTVGSGSFSQDRRGPLRIFLSATLVQFGTILAGCLLVLAPLPRAWVLGAAIGVCGGFGLAYSAAAWRDTVRDGVAAKMDLEDRLWYAVAPPIGFLLLAAAGITLMVSLAAGCAALAAAMAILLLVAIHNAWDITVWSVTRRKQ